MKLKKITKRNNVWKGINETRKLHKKFKCYFLGNNTLCMSVPDILKKDVSTFYF